MYSGTSLWRRTKGLAKFVRLNAVSLYQGSFSYILLLLRKENRLLNRRLFYIEVRLKKYISTLLKSSVLVYWLTFLYSHVDTISGIYQTLSCISILWTWRNPIWPIPSPVVWQNKSQFAAKVFFFFTLNQ